MELKSKLDIILHEKIAIEKKFKNLEDEIFESKSSVLKEPIEEKVIIDVGIQTDEIMENINIKKIKNQKISESLNSRRSSRTNARRNTEVINIEKDFPKKQRKSLKPIMLKPIETLEEKEIKKRKSVFADINYDKVENLNKELEVIEENPYNISSITPKSSVNKTVMNFPIKINNSSVNFNTKSNSSAVVTKITNIPNNSGKSNESLNKTPIKINTKIKNTEEIKSKNTIYDYFSNSKYKNKTVIKTYKQMQARVFTNLLFKLILDKVSINELDKSIGKPIKNFSEYLYIQYKNQFGLIDIAEKKVNMN